MQSIKSFAAILKRLVDATKSLKDSSQNSYIISMKYVKQGLKENFELNIKQKQGNAIAYMNNNMNNIDIIMKLCEFTNVNDAKNIYEELVNGFRNIRKFAEVFKDVNTVDQNHQLKYSIHKNVYNADVNVLGHAESLYSVELDIGFNLLYSD